MKYFIETDDSCAQHRMKSKEDVYYLIQYNALPDNEFGITFEKIDLNKYSHDETVDFIKSYGYNSIEDVQDIYGDAAKDIIAECIFESESIYKYPCMLISESENEARANVIEYIREFEARCIKRGEEIFYMTDEECQCFNQGENFKNAVDVLDNYATSEARDAIISDDNKLMELIDILEEYYTENQGDNEIKAIEKVWPNGTE